MTDEIAHARCQARRTLVNPSPGNGDSNFTKLGLYVDEIKSFLGPRLENRIRWVLQEFVCNSKSSYARQFPRVKKFLNVVAAWADTFDVPGKDTDVRREMIKHAIEYLVKDGLVTQFADPVLFNGGPNNVDPDSLAAERNAFKSTNVWRFINEKDYWLCQDCAIDSVGKENCSSDLDVEVGSISRETSTVYHTCGTTSACGPHCDRNVDGPNPSEGNVDCRNFDMSIEQNQDQLNSPKETASACNDASCRPTKEISQKSETEAPGNRGGKIENSKSSHTQTGRPLYYFVFSLNQNILNPCQAIPRDFLVSKPCTTRESAKLSGNGTTCNAIRSSFPENSKLKLYIHRATSTSDCEIRNPPKVSKLSLPCESSQLIVRLFEADPSLSDSCLVLMRKKFEKDIRNACSCMNDSLRKLEACMIRQLCLNCVIRPGRVDLNVRRTNRGCFNGRRFLARVPTCSNVHKRDSRPRSAEDPTRRDAERSKDPFVDSASRGDATKRGKEFEERRVDSSSMYQDRGSTEANRVYPARREIEKEENGGKVTLMWARGQKKKVDFALPSESTNGTKTEDFAASNERNVDANCGRTCDGERSISSDRKPGDRGEKTVEERSERGDVGQANENRIENETSECCDLDCSCSVDSLKGDTFAEESSTTGGCNPEQCFCHVLRADGTIDQDQHTGARSASLETTNRDEKNREVDRSRDSHENRFNGTEFALSRKTRVTSDKCTADDLKTKQTVSMKAERVDELESLNLSAEGETGMGKHVGDGREEEHSASEAKETYSVDSICSPNSMLTVDSCDSKCSNCGNELSNGSFDKQTNTVKDTERCEPSTELKADQTPNLAPARSVTASGTIKNSATVHSSKLKVASKIIDQSNIESTASESVPLDVSQKHRQGDLQENSTDPRNPSIDSQSKAPILFAEKTPSIPESLFVFCRETSLKDFSSTSTTDDEGIPYKYLTATPRTARTNFRLARDRSIPKTFQRGSDRLAGRNPSSSARNLHRGCSTKCKARPWATEEDGDRVGPRYKNRSWRGSLVPGSLCGSFPAIDRIKHLIRKKLRKLLLEERDKGTSTSKTYLRNDRYLVSVSSGKLNRGRIVRESCSTRCPFTARNRYATECGPETTFTEGSVPREKRPVPRDDTRDGCRRMIRGQDASKRSRVADASTTVRQKYSSKSTDTQDLTNEKADVLAKGKFQSKKENRRPTDAPAGGGNTGRISSRLSLNSIGMMVVEDEDRCSAKNRNLRSVMDNRNLPFDSDSWNIRSGGSNCRCSSSDSLPDNKGNVSGSFRRDRTRREMFRPFEKRLFRIDEHRAEGYDFVSFFSDYEKRINELDADFRLKLLQYVALCRSVKNSLIKGLQTDEAYEVGSRSFRDRRQR